MSQVPPPTTSAAAANKQLGETLLVEEYKACRDLIKTNIDIIEKSEVYAIGAAAAAAVYCLSATTELVQRAACWLPFMIAITGALRFIGIDATIKKINNHLVSIEKKFPEISWTGYYRNHNKWKVLKLSRYAIWLILAGSGLSFGLYVWQNAPLSPPVAGTATSTPTATSTVVPPSATAHSTQAPAKACLPAEMSGSPDRSK